MTQLTVNQHGIEFFVDFRCCKTLLPLQLYQPTMGPLQPSQTKFRPYGTTSYLPIAGQLPATLQTCNGANHGTTIYVIHLCLFHNKIKEALCGLPGCISIHDNIVIYGKTQEEHETNLSTCLTESKLKASPFVTANAHLAQHLSHGLATSSVPLVCQLIPAKSKPLPLPATHRQRMKSKASYKPASTMPNSCLTLTKHMHR